MTERIGGIAGWLISRLKGRRRVEPRLVLVERIMLGPRQSLALVEAEGRRILVATAAEGGPAFYPLDRPARVQAGGRIAACRPAHGHAQRQSRVTW